MDLFKIHESSFNIIKRTKESEIDPSPKSWKILIYDKESYSQLLYYKKWYLQQSNITLHMPLKGTKEQILGVDAIYLINPKKESIDQIIVDIENDLFNEIYIRFTSLVKKNLLEYFTKKVIEIKKTSYVKNIQQFFMDVVPIARDSFIFTSKGGHGEGLSIEEISLKLLSSILSFNFLPIIIIEKSNTKSMNLAENLKKLVNSDEFYLNLKDIPFNPKKIIWIRDNSDVNAFLNQSFTYAGLLTEYLGLFNTHINENLNQIKVDDKIMTVDLKGDSFWVKNQDLDIPLVAENIYKEVSALTSQYGELQGNRDNNEMSNLVKTFDEALDSLPEITERKKNNALNTSICTFLMSLIDKGELEKICAIGNIILTDKKLNDDYHKELKAIFESAKVPFNDKLRLYLLLLNNVEINHKECAIIEGLLNKDREFSPFHQNQIDKIKQRRTDGNKGSLLTKLKNKSEILLKKVKSVNWKFDVSNHLKELINPKKFTQRFEIYNLFNNKVNFDCETIEEFIIFNLNGTSINELIELRQLSQHIKKPIIYGGEYLLTGSQFISNLNLQ